MQLEWVEIPSGEFMMGTSEDEVQRLSKQYGSLWFENETPQQTVYLDHFFISKYLVTNAQFKEFKDATGYRWGASPYFVRYLSGNADHFADHPVAWISWHDALAFCQWAGCRLPTRAEWEKAARGPDGLRYPWGNEWREGFCNSCQVPPKTITTPVASYPQGASPYGVHDMAGNVWEWTDDWLISNIEPRMWHTTWADSNVRSGDEQLTHLQQFPVLRGGAVNTNQIGTRCAFRLVKYSAHGHGDWVGFRCAK